MPRTGLGLAAVSSEAAFEQYRRRIYRHIRSLVRTRGDAEDLTQETFLRAHRQLDRLNEPAALGVWLYRIATHVCYDFLRQSLRRPAPTRSTPNEESGHAQEQEPAAEGPGLDQLVDQVEMSACIQEFLDTLRDTYRTAILLHDLHGLTDAETARFLDCTVATVKIRLHRARARLRASLQRGCEFSRDQRGVLVCGRRPPRRTRHPPKPA